MAREKSEQFWQHHVDAWRANGLTQQRYCKRYGLTSTTLATQTADYDLHGLGCVDRE